MKRFISILICLILIYSAVFGQDSADSKNARKVELSFGSVIVKDSSGRSYIPSEWMPKVNSGDYFLKPIDTTKKTKEFLLVHVIDPALKKKLMPRLLPSYFFKTGEIFKNFQAKDTGENKINTANFIGKTLVLNFWFIDCPPCQAEIPALNELSESYKQDSSVIFVAVALDSKSRLKNFLQKNPFGYKMIYNGRPVAAQYGIGLYPTNVVVDQNGKVVFHTTGVTNNTIYWIRETIEDLKRVNSQ
jgi:thiol-disulfide isomerase/thioredoxin